MRESVMRRTLICEIPEVFFQRIESPGTLGIPDVYFYNKNNGESGWAELKEVNDFAAVAVVHWRPGQFKWMTKYVEMGGAGILICTSKHSDHWYFFYGSHIRKTYTLDEIDGEAGYSGGLVRPSLFTKLLYSYQAGKAGHHGAL